MKKSPRLRLNGDGDADLVATGMNTSFQRTVYLYRNDGGGSFSDQTPAAFVGHANSVLSWGDYDGDGDIDLVTNGYDSSATAIMHLYENQCAGASAVAATIDAPTPQINAGNETAYTFMGTCSEIGEEARVLVGGIAPDIQPLCQSGGGVYVVPTTDVSSLVDEPHDVQVLHCNTAGNAGNAGNDCIAEIIESVVKDSIVPVAVVITARPTDRRLLMRPRLFQEQARSEPQ